MKRIIHIKRKWLIVGTVTFLAVLALAYVLYSMQAWRGYERDYIAWQATTKSELTSVLSLPATSPKEREQKLSKLESIVADLKAQKSKVCSDDSLIGWQAFFQGVDTVKKQCHSVSSKIDGVVVELGVIISYLTNEHTFATSLAKLSTQPAQPDEKTWDQVAGTWRKFGVDVAAMKVDASFESTKKVAVTVVTGVDTAWQELLAAHSVKDKARFVKARSGLAVAYAALTTITTENDKQVASLDKKLTKAYSAVF